MRNRIVVMLVAASLMVGGTPALAAAADFGFPGRSQARASFASGGLGLTHDEWEAMYGSGQPGQPYLKYALADGAYNVGIDGQGGPIFFIERTWDDPAGVSLATAQTEARRLFPSDATFGEYYDGASAKILYGTGVERYRSSSLSKQVKGTDRNLTGSFAVIYEKVPAPASYDQNVTRMVLVIATKNPNRG